MTGNSVRIIANIVYNSSFSIQLDFSVCRTEKERKSKVSLQDYIHNSEKTFLRYKSGFLIAGHIYIYIHIYI